MEYRYYDEGRLHMVFGITNENEIRLLHFSSAPFEPKEEPAHYYKEGYQFAQINLSGLNRPYEKQGSMYVCTEPGASMKFLGIREEEKKNGQDRILVITQKDEATGVKVVTRIRLFDGISAARFTNTVINEGTEEQTLEYLGSFSYLGLEKEGASDADHKMLLYVPHNGWQKELCWQKYTFEQLGLPQTQPHVFARTSKTIEYTNTGNWSAKDYLPMAYLENTEADTGLFFQIEHDGSWHWEIGMQNEHFFLNVSGPTEIQSHFSKQLKPGDSFTAVPVTAGVSRADVSEAMDELTRCRRAIRRPNADDRNLPVIFNDYMNCLFGDPTTEKELPLIDAAARAGCEYFVIDAGWYAPGEWWDGVGEWKECRERFPGGIREVCDRIREKGMVPGVWVEPEVMGIRCDLAGRVPDDWFFMRHGKRVFDRSRYQLDYRNPEVIRHMNEVIDRIVNEYGVGYFKFDYNIEPGIGTETDADSFGDGLLQHERSYLAWLDSLFERYPDLVIENCSSGGLRMDYALLSRCSIQSTSDQEDYIQYSTIAANVPSGVTSEQAAVWSYPLKAGSPAAGNPIDPEETVFNMVNAMLCRIHQSGHLAEISPERFALVQEGIACYKKIRRDIPESMPFWPLGLARTIDPWVCLAIRVKDRAWLAVWRRSGKTGQEDRLQIPLKDLWRSMDAGSAADTAWNVRVAYPAEKLAEHCRFRMDGNHVLTVEFTQPAMARVFEISRT